MTDRTLPSQARKTAMDLLARRAHSERELFVQLERLFSPVDAADAVAFAREKGWLTAPAELAERIAFELSRRGKGHALVQRHLEEKGLPPTPRDWEAELRKARAFAESRLAHPYPYDYEEQTKLSRWLASRGFDEDVIEAAIRSY